MALDTQLDHSSDPDPSHRISRADPVTANVDGMGTVLTYQPRGLGGGAGAAVVALPAVAEPMAPRSARWIGGLRSLRTFESFGNAHFRWYFLSMLGVFGAMNMQMLVRGFIVFDLTGSYVALGTISMANAIPGLALSLPGGVVADRIPKKLVQQIGSSLNAVNTLWVGVLLVGGWLRFEHLLVNAVLQGIIQALMMPSRQSMLPDLVYPRQLMNAVALNNVGMNLSRLIMPAIGGFLLAVTHSYWVFFIMTGFYVVAVLTLMKVPAKPIEIPAEEQVYAASMAGAGARAGRGGHGGAPGARRSATGLGDIWEGMRYIARDRTIGMILLINFLMVMFSMPYMQMLPGFVRQVLDGGAGMQGILMSFTAVGSLASALVIASLPSRHRGKLLLGGALVLGVALTAFSFSNIFWVTAPVMIFLGAGQSARMAVSNTLVQSYADDRYRGRVMSIYMMEMSLVQIGTFFVGLAAETMGVQWALGLTSMSLVALSVGAYLFVPRLRHLD